MTTGVVEDQSEVTRFLRDPSLFGAAEPVTVIETHVSRVFLAGDTALKLKRAVKLPYVDFSSAEIRLAACEREFTLNAPTAPQLYRGVRRIVRSVNGTLAFDAEGPLVDAVVEMRRFDQNLLLDRRAAAGLVTADIALDLARTIHAFHARAPVSHERTGSEILRSIIDLNLVSFREQPLFAPDAVDTLDRAFRRALDRHAAHLDRRSSHGWVRRCHGDLHLRNICLIDGKPVLFDCLDFSEALSTIDVLYDLAFLLMDLWHRGLKEIANLVANRYVDEDDSDDGYALLSFFMAVRAAIRAHVTATAADGKDDPTLLEEARSYFRLAGELLEEAPPCLVAIGGFSGSGKTTVSALVAPNLLPAPGARTLETDRLRKAMFGVPAETHLPAEAYKPPVSARVYAMLEKRAEALLRSGASVVTAAVFDRPDTRAAMEAAASGSSFAGVWLEVGADALRKRLSGRPRGASDADLSVLDRQLATPLEGLQWARIASGSTPEATADAILAAAHSTMRNKRPASR
ncbi:MAG: AAA family ATPase [Hyphomicrobiales bacterium]